MGTSNKNPKQILRLAKAAIELFLVLLNIINVLIFTAVVILLLIFFWPLLIKITIAIAAIMVIVVPTLILATAHRIVLSKSKPVVSINDSAKIKLQKLLKEQFKKYIEKKSQEKSKTDAKKKTEGEEEYRYMNDKDSKDQSPVHNLQGENVSENDKYERFWNLGVVNEEVDKFVAKHLQNLVNYLSKESIALLQNNISENTINHEQKLKDEISQYLESSDKKLWLWQRSEIKKITRLMTRFFLFYDKLEKTIEDVIKPIFDFSKKIENISQFHGLKSDSTKNLAEITQTNDLKKEIKVQVIESFKTTDTKELKKLLTSLSSDEKELKEKITATDIYITKLKWLESLKNAIEGVEYDERMILKIWDKYIQKLNLQYWYCDPDKPEDSSEYLSSLFKSGKDSMSPLKANECGILIDKENKLYINQNRKSVSICGAVGGKNSNISPIKHLTSALRQIQRWQTINLTIKDHVILFIYWSGHHYQTGTLELKFNSNKNKLEQSTITLYNPCGGGSSCSYKKTIEKAINEIFSKKNSEHQLTEPNVLDRIQQQQDKKSCGTITAENGKDIIEVTTNRLEKKYPEGALDLRLQHIEEVNDKGFTNLATGRTAAAPEPAYKTNETQEINAKTKKVIELFKEGLKKLDQARKPNDEKKSETSYERILDKLNTAEKSYTITKEKTGEQKVCRATDDKFVQTFNSKKAAKQYQKTKIQDEKLRTLKSFLLENTTHFSELCNLVFFIPAGDENKINKDTKYNDNGQQILENLLNHIESENSKNAVI